MQMCKMFLYSKIKKKPFTTITTMQDWHYARLSETKLFFMTNNFRFHIE